MPSKIESEIEKIVMTQRVFLYIGKNKTITDRKTIKIL